MGRSREVHRYTPIAKCQAKCLGHSSDQRAAIPGSRMTYTSVMDLPFRPHFTITCSCGEACAAERSFSADELSRAQTDPVIALRMLPPAEQRAAAMFYDAHKKRGHSPEPRLVGLAPLPKA